MSGAGRSSAAAVLEDLGWFVIDNVPSALIVRVAELVAGRAQPGAAEDGPGAANDRIAFVAGRGGTDYVASLLPVLDSLRKSGQSVHVLFLDASDEVLVRRFEGTRRRHPMPGEGVISAIQAERRLVQPVRDSADVVVDTSDLNVHELRARLLGIFERVAEQNPLSVNVVSFGFKYGIPLDVDLVLDCRFLPNPHWVEELRPLSGKDEPVRDYVLAQPESKAFLEKIDDLMGLALPGYVREGKSYLSVAVGCTGGRHRSVAIAEELAAALRHRGFRPSVTHRDIER